MNAASRLKSYLPADVAEWLSSCEDDLAEAWNGCARADWLLHMAAAVEVDRGMVVQAAHDLASLAVAARDPDGERSTSALRHTLAWIEGRARSSHAWASAFAAAEAAEREEDPLVAAAMRAAAFVAFACDDDADASFYAHRAYAAKAAEQVALALPPDAIRAAVVVRARIPLQVFLDAYEVASQPPPPIPDVDPDATTDSFYA